LREGGVVELPKGGVVEEKVQIKTADGTAAGVLFRDPGGRRLPGVIQLTDIAGIRPSQRDMARRLAEAGYTVLMPNVFYRTGEPPFFTFPLNMADEGTRKRFANLAAPLTPPAIERDGAAYVDFMAVHDAVLPGPLGVVGYCYSGAVALRIAAARADTVAAAASFHGGGLYTDSPTSPHLVLPRIAPGWTQLYFAHAVQDRSMPAEAIEKLDRALAAWGGTYESEVYDGAFHSWTTPDSPVYNKAASDRAFQKLTEQLATALRT
jgi:carboxymethylenebutenolidase